MIEPCFRKSIVFSSGLVNEAIAHKVFTSFRKSDLYIARRITDRFSDSVMGHNTTVSKSRFDFCCLD